MKKFGMLGCLGAVAVVAVILGIWAISGYNGLVTNSQRVDAQWAQVQSVYQRRADLIPNLVSTVSGAANFEKSTIIEVTRARASVGQSAVPGSQAPTNPADLQKFQAAQDQLSSALSRLLVVVEKYPELKANENFRDLQAQIEGTENRITVERQKFNETVKDYNVSTKRFPTVLIAGMMNFKEKPYFTASPGSDKAPEVKFDFGTPAKAPATP